MADPTKRADRPARRLVHLEKDRPVADLEGIGEAFAARLRALGVGTLHALEAADADTLGPEVGTQPATVRQWQSMAELTDIHGVGPQYAELLLRAGVGSIRELAASDAAQLASAVEEVEAGRERRIQGGPEGAATLRRFIESAQRHPRLREKPPGEAAPAPIHHERIVVIPTRLYWTVLLLSALFLFLAVGLYRDYLSSFAFGIGLAFRWITVAAALVAIVWCAFGLLRRGRIVHRTVRGTAAFASGISEGFAARSDANEGAMGRLATKWSNRFSKLARAVVWLVKLPFRILVWAWYTSEKLVWRIVLILYDIVYYPTYTAWLLAHWAVRTALRITWWALGVAWKILRLPLKLPLIRTWWRRSGRPPILAQWRAMAAHQAHLRAQRIERGRRLAQLRGENPDRWEADHKHRRGFPLPHPEKGRIRIRKRIAHIVEVERARKEGRPIPRKARAPRERKEEPAGEAVAPATEPEGGKRLAGILKRGSDPAPAADGKA